MDQLFRGGFAVTSRDTNKGYLTTIRKFIELETMMFSKILQCLQCVFNHDHSIVDGIFFLIDHGICSAFFQCVFGEFITIETWAFQCNIDASL